MQPKTPILIFKGNPIVIDTPEARARLAKHPHPHFVQQDLWDYLREALGNNGVETVPQAREGISPIN